MIQEARVENLCARKRCQSISIDATQRCCLNCMWYEQYYRRTRGNVAGWVGTAEGFCLLHDKKCAALKRPCGDYEQKEIKRQ